jgi:hypothetical protein
MPTIRIQPRQDSQSNLVLYQIKHIPSNSFKCCLPATLARQTSARCRRRCETQHNLFLCAYAHRQADASGLVRRMISYLVTLQSPIL